MSSYHEPAGAVQDSPPGEDLRPFTAEQLEALTGLPRRFWWAAAREQTVPSIRIDRKILFPRPALLRILAEGNLSSLPGRQEGGRSDA